MLIELILALLMGVIIGCITGIIPGLHINLVAVILSSLIFSSIFQPAYLIVFLVSLSIAHTFVDFIPSIFLGAPNEDDTALSILPGHEMMLNGQAYKAVIITIYGCLVGIVLVLLFTPIFILFLPKIYTYAERIMPLILILISFFLIYFEKASKFWAFIIFVLAGILGLTTLNLPLKEPLLALFTGLFGISSLITSLNKKSTIPLQKILKLKEIKIGKKSFFKTVLASSIASPLCSFLPGLGSGQAAVIGSEVTGELDRKEFLFLLGCIGTLVTGLSFVTLYSISKARTGIAVFLSKIIDLNSGHLNLILITLIISSFLAFFMTILLAKIFTKIVNKINYNILSIGVIIFLILLVSAFSGFLGLLVLIASTLLGLTCIYSGIRRTHLMGCLIIPSIILFLL